MIWVLDQFAAMNAWQASAWLLGINVAMFVLSVGGGEVLVRLFADHTVTPPPDPLERKEVFLAISCVFLNGVVAIVGWFLWRAGIIEVSRGTGWRVVIDMFVLLVVMDFAMYVFHRLAHVRWIYPWVHGTHHTYDRPRPLDLFVLNPFEVLGFGTLWLLVLSAYTATWAGIVLYLAANLAFGTIGHLGVEPYPKFLREWRVFRHLGSSTFHADHHQDGRVNYGFYSDVWDRLFGTLRRRGR